MRRFFIPVTNGVRSKFVCPSRKNRGAGGIFFSPARRQGCGGNFCSALPYNMRGEGGEGG